MKAFKTINERARKRLHEIPYSPKHMERMYRNKLFARRNEGTVIKEKAQRLDVP